MSDSQRAIDVFLQAAEHNRDDPLRNGSQLRFPNYGQLVMTGDLHGHRRNFAKLQQFCDLERYAARHVVLHELIHEEVNEINGMDTSHEAMLLAAEWKCTFPDQVHFLQSNHELAQLNRHEITKNGRVVTAAFEQSVFEVYGDGGSKVLDAILTMIGSYPLSGKTPNRIFISHSLPSPNEVEQFDVSVFDREPTDEDLDDGGAGHALVWGRYHTPEALAFLKNSLDTDFFICGHQPQEMGYGVFHDSMIVLASDHNHGVFLPIDLGKPTTIETLTSHIRPFAGVV